MSSRCRSWGRVGILADRYSRLTRGRIVAVLDELRTDADTIVVAAPSIPETAETQLVCAAADLTILVVARGRHVLATSPQPPRRSQRRTPFSWERCCLTTGRKAVDRAKEPAAAEDVPASWRTCGVGARTRSWVGILSGLPARIRSQVVDNRMPAWSAAADRSGRAGGAAHVFEVWRPILVAGVVALVLGLCALRSPIFAATVLLLTMYLTLPLRSDRSP